MVFSRYTFSVWANRSRPPIENQSAQSAIESDEATHSESAEMGKSNKFDFSNRSSSGVKLGKSIGQSLEKEAVKVQKEAEKHKEKAARQSRGSSADDVNGTDPKGHYIDLQAPNKELGDDGFAFVATGLGRALQSANYQIVLSLEDLNLSGNKLTTASLACLAPVIDLAAHTLKTLNITNNAVTVVTDQQAREWDMFLAAFRHCYKLRRLDLSFNDLGMRAFEIFTRIHASEPPVDPRSVGDMSVTSLNSITSDASDESDSSLIDTGVARDAGSPHPLAMGQILRRRQGVRSIPFITMHRVGMDDVGALWLSYVIEDHHFPIQLVDSLNAPSPGSSVRAYQQDANQNGMDYGNNPALSKDAVLVLEKAEAVRRRAALEEPKNRSESPFSYGPLDVCEEDGASELFNGHLTKNAQDGRRVSVRSTSSTEAADQETLNSMRKKLQRHTIEQHGFSVVEIWNAAFSVFWAARKLAYLMPPRICIDEPLFPVSATRVESESGSSRTSASSDPGTPQHSRQSSYAATLLASASSPNGEMEVFLSETANSRANQNRTVFKPQRKGGFSESADVLEGVTDRLMDAGLGEGKSRQFVEYQQRRMATDAGQGKYYGDDKAGLRLPSDVITDIIRGTVSDKQWSMLSDVQRRLAADWGSDKQTLAEEAKWAKHAASYQVWTLLEKIQGLEYAAE